MLKPYKERVFSTKSILESSIEIMNENAEEILDINRDADEIRIEKYSINKEPLPVKFKTTEKSTPFEWKGIEFEMKDSKAAGTQIPYYTGVKFTKTIPYFNDVEVVETLTAPEFYIIPKEYKELVDIMELHGIDYSVVQKSEEMELIKTKFKNITFAKNPYEGRFRPSYETETISEIVKVNAGDYIIKTNQREVSLILHLLEPSSDDSFLKWGMMNHIFERKEYFEMYLIDSLANKMYEENESLRKEFDEMLKDEKFAQNPYARLNFFYEHSPFFDEKYNVYPILKSVK